MVEVDWIALRDHLITAVVVILVVWWVVVGAAVGVIWGAASQRTNSMIVAILYGIIMLPLELVWESPLGWLIWKSWQVISWPYRRLVEYYTPPPPPPPPPPEPYVPRARPEKPAGEGWQFDYERWEWRKKDE